MPLYEYECQTCRLEFEETRSIEARHGATCSRCGSPATLMVPSRPPGVTSFRPGVWRDLGFDPVRIETPQQLRDYCDKHNKRAPYLEDGVWRTSPGPDPNPESAPELFGGGPRPEEGGKEHRGA